MCRNCTKVYGKSTVNIRFLLFLANKTISYLLFIPHGQSVNNLHEEAHDNGDLANHHVSKKC